LELEVWCRELRSRSPRGERCFGAEAFPTRRDPESQRRPETCRVRLFLVHAKAGPQAKAAQRQDRQASRLQGLRDTRKPQEKRRQRRLRPQDAPRGCFIMHPAPESIALGEHFWSYRFVLRLPIIRLRGARRYGQEIRLDLHARGKLANFVGVRRNADIWPWFLIGLHQQHATHHCPTLDALDDRSAESQPAD